MICQQADRFAALRVQMVEYQMRERGIRDERVLAAFAKVPREKFVPPEHEAEAYDDHPLPIGLGQTISQPYMVALMTECLRLEGKEKVLEIGTGSGYQTAILALLAREVYTIERLETLSHTAAKVLAELKYNNIHFLVGDGTLGWPEHAPYDRILVTAGAPDVPVPLVEQLVDGGLLVIPVGGEQEQELIVVEKAGQKRTRRHICYCHFVKLIGKQGWAVSEGGT